jgi:hypothetical protein
MAQATTRSLNDVTDQPRKFRTGPLQLPTIPTRDCHNPNAHSFASMAITLEGRALFRIVRRRRTPARLTH